MCDRDRFNEGLQELRSSGEYNAILKRYGLNRKPSPAQRYVARGLRVTP